MPLQRAAPKCADSISNLDPGVVHRTVATVKAAALHVCDAVDTEPLLELAPFVVSVRGV